MSIETALPIAANLAGSLMGSNAASDAADAQSRSAAAATQLQKDMFDKQVQLQEPFRQAGIAGNNRLLDLLGLSGNTSAPGYGSGAKTFGMSDFQADPGYQFQQEQGLQALDRSASSRGMLNSGRSMKDILKYSQGLASGEYQNAFNRFQTNRASVLNPLQSLSGAGQTAAGTIGNAAGQYGANAGNNIMGAGNAQASGMVGGANAWSNGIGSAINNYNQNKLFSLINQRSGVGGFGGSGSGGNGFGGGLNGFFYGNGTSGD